MTAHLKLGAQFVTIVNLSNVINVNDANKDSFENDPKIIFTVTKFMFF